MALSGSVNTNAYEVRFLQLTWSAKQNIENNTSTISWTLKGAGSDSGTWYMAGGFKVVIDGSTVYSTSADSRIKLYGNTTVASGSKVLSHNSDGTKSFSISVSGAIYTYAINCNGSGNFTLDTIPRASSISVPTLTLGTPGTITINRASSSFTHTLTYNWGSTSDTIATKTSSTSVSWTPPLSLANYIPNNSLGQGTIKCDTYNGSTLIGSKSVSFYGKVLDIIDTKPGVTLNIAEAVEDVKTKIGAYVKDLSKLAIDINATGRFNASIKSYSIKANGATYNDSSAITEPLNMAGDMTITATATDSRGYVGTTSITINVLDYTKPKINIFTAERSDASGTVSESGGSLKVNYDVDYTSLNGANEVSTNIKYKKKDETDYTSVSLSDLVGSKVLADAVDINYTYDVLLEVSDSFNTTTVSTIISTAFTLLDFNSSGKGMAIGKVSEEPDKVEIALPLKFKDNILADLIYPVGSIYMSANSVNPGTLFGGTWERVSGKFLLGADDTYTAGSTGGEAEHTLTVNEIPAHEGHLYSNFDNSGYADRGGDDNSYYINSSATDYSKYANRPYKIVSGNELVMQGYTRGGGLAHNNIPPYLAIYIWKRTL